MRSSSAYIVVDQIAKAYVPAEPVIDGISIVISRGELVCLYGPNGCGKTSFLRIVSGMDKDYAGTVRIANKAPEHASVGIVPQDSDVALLPWRNVADNIALPLEVDGSSLSTSRQAVSDFVTRAGIDLPMYKYPYQLSAGQKQLVSIVRALIGRPDLLVLDEPFASLDFAHTALVEGALLRLWNLTETTTLLVTHDLLGAIQLADRVLLLSPRPMRVVYSREINLPRPRPRHDPVVLSLLSELQRIFVTSSQGP